MNLKPTKNIIPEMRIPGARAVKGVVLEISMPNKIKITQIKSFLLEQLKKAICC